MRCTLRARCQKAVSEPLNALWWDIATLSTVGFGDIYPITPEGRVAAMVLLVLGIGLYSAITAAVTSYFVIGSRPGRRGDFVDELERLAGLRESLDLTDEELSATKQRLLSR